jgi:curli production assembly/transport component CsgF
MKTIIISVLASVIASTANAQLVHQFNSPSFSGSGYSHHVLTIEQLEANRKKANADAQKAAQEKAERDAKNTNLAKFLVNVESRIYAQLSKQLADAMFAEGSADSGSFDFQGTTISYVKTGTDVTLTITETTGNRTEITVPLSSFSF